MDMKYGERMHAATLFYALLGRPGDRVALVVRLSDPWATLLNRDGTNQWTGCLS